MINPAIVYGVTWLTALFLYSLHYSGILVDISTSVVNYILLSICMPLLAWLLVLLVIGKASFKSQNQIQSDFLLRSSSKIKFLSIVSILGFIISLLYFHDLPIFTTFGYGTMSYAQYGIPSFQGFLNAILESLSMYALFLFFRKKNKQYLMYYIVTLLFPLVVMNRGMLISMLLQSVFTVFVFNKIKTMSLIKVFFVAIIIIYIFGILGTVRYIGTGGMVTLDLFSITENYPTWLPKNFIWFYTYFTSSISNLNLNMHHYRDLNFQPSIVLYSLLPTIIRSQIEIPVTTNLVNVAFNVSSFMPSYLAAFGYFGSLVFYFFASFVPIYFYYKFKITGFLRYGFILVIFLHSIVLSIFSDFFFIQVYCFQILLQFYIFLGYKRKTSKERAAEGILVYQDYQSKTANV